MLNLFKKLGLKPLKLLPDLDEYNVPDRPRRTVVVEKVTKATGSVHAGKEWRTEWDDEGKMWSGKVNADVPATAALVVLDEYDQGYLTYILGEKWRRDETRAKVMKWHWQREESAANIQTFHTAAGKLESGFSERVAADYIKAFFQADDAREADGKTRLRTAPMRAETKVDW